jgi:regulator of sigma E protease
MIINSLITVFALSVVIFVHELAHMIFARKAGIGVIEFSVGMGPKYYSKKIGETIYSLRLFPIGGFVKLAGLDDEDPEEKTALPGYYDATMWGRASTIMAGSLMNIVFGFLIFFWMYSAVGIPQITNQIDMVLPNSPAYEMDLLKGDRIVKINGIVVTDVHQDITQVIHQSAEKSIELTCKRGEIYRVVTIIPRDLENNGKGLIGIVFASSHTSRNPFLIIKYAVKDTIGSVVLVFKSLKMLVSGGAKLKDLAGPIGIIQFASFSLSKSVLGFLNIIATISISLGIVNLLPIPVLDGGHLLFLGIETFRKKRLSKKAEEIIGNAGAALLISLMVFIIFNDIINWNDRVSFLRNLTGN